MFLLLFLACSALTLALEDEQQYCGPRYTHLCLGKGQHVACQFPVEGSGPNCQNYSKIRFTSELRNYITSFINKRRQKIAAGHERGRGGKYIPQPQVMMYVEWDFELARLAERLADQCYFVHDECRATVKYPYAGQAVGEVRWRHMSNNYELDARRGIRRVFDAWWGERRRVEPDQLVQPFRITDKGVVWGHFSQLAVWTLRAVGCGAVRHGEEYPRLLLITEQIKQSRKVEEEIIDETDYDDPEQDSPEMKAIREQLKKMEFVTLKFKQNDEDWGNNKLKTSEEFDDTTRIRWTTTTAYIDEFHDEEEIVASIPKGHPHHPARGTSSTTRHPTKGRPRSSRPPVCYIEATKEAVKNQPNTSSRLLLDSLGPSKDTIHRHLKSLETKASYKNMKQKVKQNHHRTFRMTTEGMSVTDGYNTLPGKSFTESKPSEFYNQRLILPADMNAANSEEDTDDQDTLILSATSTPFVMQTKPRPQDRLKHKMTATTIATTVIQNPHLQYSPRQRWKPERDRPERPGAAALLRPSQQPPKMERNEPAIPPRISFKMDEDDAEQLRADTGFLPSWKKNETLKGAL